MIKVLHVLASNRFSGAENVVCQIVDMFNGEIEMAYCSPDGPIKDNLKDKKIKFFPINKLSKKELKKIINDYSPDVIHAHDLKASIICASFANKVKVVSMIHGNKSNMNKLSLKSLAFYFACKKISQIIWVSKSCYDSYYFRRNIASKSLVLPNIISIDNLKKQIMQSDDNFHSDIIFLGRLVYEKNPIRIVEIAKNVVKQLPNTIFSIVGDGVLREDVKSKVSLYGLERNFIFWGFKNNPYGLLNNSKLMILSSVMEGTPMCAIESLTCGVPVVSTKTDGMLDLIDDTNGFLYDSDVEACNFIVKYLNDKNLQNEMRQNCVHWATKYNNLSDYKDKLKHIYEEPYGEV